MRNASVTKLPIRPSSALSDAAIELIKTRTTEATAVIATVRNALSRSASEPENSEHDLIHVMNVVERLLDDTHDMVRQIESVQS